MGNAKEYLQKMRMYDARIESKLLEVQQLKAMITKITPTLKEDVVTASGNQDKLGDAVAKIVVQTRDQTGRGKRNCSTLHRQSWDHCNAKS